MKGMKLICSLPFILVGLVAWVGYELLGVIQDACFDFAENINGSNPTDKHHHDTH